MRQQIEERKCTDMQVRRAELTSLLFAEETKYQVCFIRYSGLTIC